MDTVSQSDGCRAQTRGSIRSNSSQTSRRADCKTCGPARRPPAGECRTVIKPASNTSPATEKNSRSRPWASIQQVRPLLVQRTSGTPFSTARKTAPAACCQPAGPWPNQPSSVRFTRKSVSGVTWARASSANASSKQISVEKRARGFRHRRIGPAPFPA